MSFLDEFRNELRLVLSEELDRRLPKLFAAAGGDEMLTFAEARKFAKVSQSVLDKFIARGLQVYGNPEEGGVRRVLRSELLEAMRLQRAQEQAEANETVSQRADRILNLHRPRKGTT